MRKLAILLSLALVIGTAGVAQVQAGTYGTDITIYDNAVGPDTGGGTEVPGEAKIRKRNTIPQPARAPKPASSGTWRPISRIKTPQHHRWL